MPNIDSAVVRAHSPALLAFAMRAVHQREQAEDLVQETWASALKSVHAFEGRASLRTWLTRILQCRIADHYRKWRFDEELEEQSSNESAEAWFGTRELADVAQRALAELSTLEREAVLLCDVQDTDRDQAAERMGVTRGHLRVLLFRGRQKLATSLTEAGLELPRRAQESV
jgi:RNA polymerase sigma-70 factor (ECF subfamily)